MERGDSSDRVFSLLVREFGQSEIDREIYAALKAAKNPDLSCHQMILDLSRGVDGRHQLVTPNFDLMFEDVEKRISRAVPPALLDLTHTQALEGAGYLDERPH